MIRSDPTARARLAVHAAIVCLAGLLAGSSARASAGPADVRQIGAGTIVVSAGPGLDAGALREALALRLPEVELREDGEMSCETGCVRVSVEREPDDSLRISVRLADGRVFARRWPATPAEPERAAATSLSHLLAAIADGTAEPEPPVIETAQPDPPSVTVAPQQVCPRPAVVAPPVERSSPTPPRFEIGPTVGLVTAFGVGVPQVLAGAVGSGGLVGAELRHRNGLLAGLEVRALGARAEGLRLGRVRVSLALGHSFRRGRFELRTRAAVLVEPWWVGTGARPQTGPPLLGGALSLTPGLSLALAPDLRVDVGLRMEAAVSAHALAGAAVRLVDPAGTPVFRLGGVELAAAAEIGVRWGRPRRGR